MKNDIINESNCLTCREAVSSQSKIAIGYGGKNAIADEIFKSIAQILNKEIECARKKNRKTKEVITEIHLFVNKEAFETDKGRIYTRTDMPSVKCKVITDVL